MAKGVKRIKWTGTGKVIGKLSTPNVKVVIPPDQEVFFDVDLWHEGTSEAEKKKSLTWILQDYKTRTIILQKVHVATIPQKISIPKPLCGPFEYYIEASLFGTRDLINKTGLRVRGECPPKIVNSKWCTTNDGADVRKSHFFNYGEKLYLNLMTEGLNGHLNLCVDIFRHLDFKSDPILHRYTSVDVTDGEINLQINDTYTWYGKLKGIKETEEFYVKVFDPAKKVYITDSKNDTEHGRFLRINKKIFSTVIKPPTNLSPLKTGKPDESKERFDFCKFETIGITEINKAHTIVFDKGVKLANEQNPKTTILKTILFDFDQAVLTPEAKSTISNVLQYLLGTRHSRITIDGHACVIGKEQYNQKLSQQRSDAVKKAFTDAGLAADRVTSIGHGEVNATDDKKGRDNIKYKDEKEYKENRRVDILFDTFGHDAQTIVFETIAPSTKQDMIIDVTDYDNKGCHKEGSKHKKNIKIKSTEIATIDKVTNKLNFPVNSSISVENPMPLQYIWPLYNLLKIGGAEKRMDSATNYFVDVHSCRYFSNDANHTIHIKAYPDIKWHLEFFINLTNDLGVGWTKQSDYKLKELQSKAGKIGAERRWKQKEASIGFSLVAKWDNDKQSKELKHKYDTKFKKLYDVFNSLGSLADGITSKTKGTISSKSMKNVPASFVVKPPNLSFTGDWFLSHPLDKKSKIGTDVTIGLHANPLIGLEATIDLLGAIVFIGGEIVGLGPGVLKLYNLIQGQLKSGIKEGNEENGLSASVDIYMDLIITSTILIDTDINFNTAGKAKDSKLKIETKAKLKVELKVGLKIRGEAAAVIIKVKAYFEASASADASVTFAHTINYDEKGLYYRPKLGFDGMNAKYVVCISIGLAMKIVKDKEAVEKTEEDAYILAEGDIPNVIPPFDVISELEQLFNISANIPLIKS